MASIAVQDAASIGIRPPSADFIEVAQKNERNPVAN
jgi:hypothetical protein